MVHLAWERRYQSMRNARGNRLSCTEIFREFLGKSKEYSPAGRIVLQDRPPLVSRAGKRYFQ
jgi:hypothetical protein